VSGVWTEPKATCTTSQSTYSAFWVGLGGGGEQSTALEQAGTQADCTASGAAYYYAWYELVPSAPVKLDLKISPGDSVYSRIGVSGDQVTVYLADRTSGQSVTKTLTMSSTAPDTSTAEWIAEAPSECASSTLQDCTPLPLTDFGSVEFHNADATADGHTGSISDSHWTSEAVELSPDGSQGFPGGGYGGYGGPGGYGSAEAVYQAGSSDGAAPSSLSSKGTTFKVTYGGVSATGTSSATSPTYSDSGGYGGYGYGGYGYGSYGNGSYGYGDYVYGAGDYTSVYGYGGYGGY
jgi:hypothetical protein